MWLPFQVSDTHIYNGFSIKPWSQGWPDNSSSEAAVNITYYKSSQPLLMQDAWRQSSKKRQGQGAPYCVVATMGESRTLKGVTKCVVQVTRRMRAGWSRSVT